MAYGIIFWGNSSHSQEIFKIQEKIIRIIMNSSKNAFCWQIFKELNTLSIQFQYIFPILLFVNKNKPISNSQLKNISTGQTSNLLPTYSKFGNIPKGCLLLRNYDLQSFTNSH
jgi:hypothetical protein